MKLKFVSSLMFACALSAAAQGYQDGVDNFNADRFDVAKIILNNTINDQATDKAVSYYYLGEIDILENNLTSAKANFDKGVAANPENGFNYIGLGTIALKNGNKADAEKLFKEGMSTNKKNTALIAAVARAYYNADPALYQKEIDKYIDKALKSSKNSEPAAYILQGDMEAKNDPGKAAGKYEMAIEQANQKGEVNREAYVKYANTYFHVNPQFAISRLEELNEREPNSALAQRELAEKYYENNNFGKARYQYEKYMSNPNHFQNDEQRYAGLLFSAKEYDKSLEIANKVLEKDPDNYFMYRVIMLNKNAMKDYAAAEEAGRKLFGHPSASLLSNDYLVFGDVLLAVDKGAEAVEVYEKAVELNPDRPELLVNLSTTYEKAGMPDKAVETMKKYLDSGNGSVNDIYQMARKYDTLARTFEKESPERVEAAKEGLKYIDMAIEKVPNNGNLYRLKGQLLLSIDGKPSADMAAAYEKMLECFNADPANKEKYASSYQAAYYMLGLYYLDVDKAKAKQYFTDYLQINPDDEDVRNMLDTMGSAE